ncbi:MAG: MFS transporter [Gemmataceae bacterium]|nr:MFS transporter [Gemmataceae bacterium]MDW8266701.1 MFS transporter [Gemmataceae bacterium]
MPRTDDHGEARSHFDPITAHNVRAESFFSVFNGIYMGLAILAAPVVAVTGVQANPVELTILVSAFPVGVFFGPLWAALGRRWGMQKLVTQMALWANVPLFFLFWVQDAAWFTALITVSQLLNSAMRMGQSSLYHAMYAKRQRGRILGQLTFWTFLTMVPSILAAGWLLDKSPQFYRVLYPMAGLCGLIGGYFYSTLHVPAAERLPRRRPSFRSGLNGVERILATDRAYLLFQFAFFLSGSAFFMSTHVVLLLTQERFRFGAFELACWMSVVPQLLLALSSPFWGHVLDRIGIVRLRLVISVLMTLYLGSYFGGIMLGVPWLIYLGSILQGMSNGAGQLTWSLASSHFAPQADDVPLYNGIHFVLNGIRGLVLPWVGSVLFVVVGPWSVFAAMLVSLGSVPIVLRSLSLGDGPAQEPVLRVVAGEGANKSAG